MLVVFLVLLIVWMCMAPISGAIIAAASVKVDMNRRTLQHQEGGIVKYLLVRDGQHVQLGDPLLVLQDLRTDASNALAQSLYDVERIRGARLAAEKAFLRNVEYPIDIDSRKTDFRIGELISKENALFDTRRRALDEQLGVLELQIRQCNDEMQAIRSKISSESEGLRLQREELDANQKLVDRGFIAPTRIMTIKRATTEYQTRLRQDEADLAAAEQKSSDLKYRIASLKYQYMQNAAAELKESASKLVELEERLLPTRDAAERLTVKAPVDGEVVALKVTSVGTVVAPRDPLMDIVPTLAKLIVEAKVKPEDAQQVSPGMGADVRLSGYKARITPTVEGRVTYVSSDRLVERTVSGESSYFLVNVEIDKADLEKAGNLQLKAGMPAEVHIKTIDRTALEYFFDPLTAFIGRGLRER